MPKVRNSSKSRIGPNERYGVPALDPGETAVCSEADSLVEADSRYTVVKPKTATAKTKTEKGTES